MIGAFAFLGALVCGGAWAGCEVSQSMKWANYSTTHPVCEEMNKRYYSVYMSAWENPETGNMFADEAYARHMSTDKWKWICAARWARDNGYNYDFRVAEQYIC